MPQLDKCCFTLELRIGTLIIASLVALNGLFTAGETLSHLDYLKYAPKDYVIMRYLTLVASLALTVTAIILFIGALQQIAWTCVPFLITAIIYTVLTFAESIRESLVAVDVLHLTHHHQLIVIGLIAYFLLVVYSFYKSI